MKTDSLTNFKKTIIIFLIIISTFFLWWLLLLFNTFPKKYYFQNTFNNPSETGIVVLTGGKGRVEKGLDILTEGKAQKLFISGVFEISEIESKFNYNFKYKNLLRCCIYFGTSATNTFENAYEVLDWLNRDAKIKNLILVSSYYHLPRSLMIFEKIIPEYKIKLIPVEESINLKNKFFFHSKLIISEFFKVIYTLIFYS